MIKLIDLILIVLGLILVIIGVFCDFVGAIGLIRLPNFFTRLHAATVGAIGGAVIPMLGAALIALGYEPLGETRFILAGVAFTTSLITMVLAQAGSHALARAAYRARAAPLQPIIYDALSEKNGKGEKQST
ncbi:monovalent cation/H(+) antiporter subunit G [Ignisphaera sp. 4213-co]|uniref:Monovalent cation/H(+) antiporter subunit G n=1 Tax=Ignisphaera cupida TaxID=3050454 RepID=A0ABD4Z5V2_9CREN|nr:monovalent cation/H(+) antiporter subunit G [Ignisphaera sp. 4213-co]MDK6028589.1 monovalent cation/H(+) antiporter subunit G [Ignisphaera sp. 4213-co]